MSGKTLSLHEASASTNIAKVNTGLRVPVIMKCLGQQGLYAAHRENTYTECIARVFRRDSPPTRSRRSEASGGESSSMLTSVEGNAVQGRMLL
jgi:hypothetical protein